MKPICPRCRVVMPQEFAEGLWLRVLFGEFKERIGIEPKDFPNGCIYCDSTYEQIKDKSDEDFLHLI